ncbi:helix-turn-helix domain-containing protein [Nonomuraea sp. 3-1Str]|uniref:helix-turn-helix domain-containing protein n=1 Tax=Nonomuraea sp. 3-1Str TaxID=2929801 RepID=UPI0037C8F57A
MRTSKLGRGTTSRRVTRSGCRRAVSSIARLLGVSRSTIYRYLPELKPDGPTAIEIPLARVELEAPGARAAREVMVALGALTSARSMRSAGVWCGVRCAVCRRSVDCLGRFGVVGRGVPVDGVVGCGPAGQEVQCVLGG